MSVKAKARLIFLAMFLGMFVCGALAGRLCMALGLTSLACRNVVAVVCSYLCFLGMMGIYVRVIRADPVFLRHASTESFGYGSNSSGSSSSSWWDAGVDFEGWLVLLAILALVLLVGAWIGIEGPALLLDEASAAAIAAGLTGRTVFLPDDSWLRRVIRRTIVPLALYLICSSVVMGYADIHCPGRHKLTLVVRECVMGGSGR